MAVYANQAGIPRVYPGYLRARRLSIACRGWKRGRLPDPDNLLKVFLDACNRCLLIVDDSQEWCHWDRPTLTRGDPETTVTIEDLP